MYLQFLTDNVKINRNTFLFYFVFPCSDNYTYPYLKIGHGDLCILLLPK